MGEAGRAGVLRRPARAAAAVPRRGLDPASPADRPTLSLREEHRLTPGEIVKAAIPLWPTAMRWHAGKQLRLRISGRLLLPSILPGLVEEPLQTGDRHILHTGGRFPAGYCSPPPPPEHAMITDVDREALAYFRAHLAGIRAGDLGPAAARQSPRRSTVTRSGPRSPRARRP